MELNTAKLSRRRVLGTALAVAGLAAARPRQDAFAGALVATPRQGMGPFYPEAKPLDQDNDLTNVQGKTGRARGRLLHVVGRVFDSAGELVKDGRPRSAQPWPRPVSGARGASLPGPWMALR